MEVYRFNQLVRSLRVNLFAGSTLYFLVGVLKASDIEPHIGVVVNSNPLSIYDQASNLFRVLVYLQGALELPEGLTKILAGLGAGIIAPQKVGQGFARVSTIATQS